MTSKELEERIKRASWDGHGYVRIDMNEDGHWTDENDQPSPPTICLDLDMTLEDFYALCREIAATEDLPR